MNVGWTNGLWRSQAFQLDISFLYLIHNSSMNTFESLRPFPYHLCNFIV